MRVAFCIMHMIMVHLWAPSTFMLQTTVSQARVSRETTFISRLIFNIMKRRTQDLIVGLKVLIVLVGNSPSRPFGEKEESKKKIETGGKG